MDKIEKKLFNTYAIELCKHQIAIHQIRQTRMDTSIQRYFNSTQARNTFARVMVLASYVNTLYTKSNIADELVISRQAAHTMVEECLSAGWVEHGGECCGGKGYRATQEVVDAMENYIHEHIKALKNDRTMSAFLALYSYEQLRQTD